MRRLLCLSLLLLGLAAPVRAGEARVRALRVTILSTMLADAGIGEWGFAALVEADGRRLLFDTGARPDTVLRNAEEIGVDLASVHEVVLSHHHGDHTGGLLRLRRELRGKDPAALSRAHVARGFFWSRPPGAGGAGERNPMVAARAAYEALGGSWVEHDGPASLAPGVWLTGPVPRTFAERNWSGTGRVRAPAAVVEDTLPEDQSLVLDTDRGLVLLSGCGHAGIVNTMTYAQKQLRQAPFHAVMGGFHLYQAGPRVLEFTAQKLREMGVAQFIGAHCTGIEAVGELRRRLGLDRRTCVVGAVGAVFDLGKGIDPRELAR